MQEHAVAPPQTRGDTHALPTSVAPCARMDDDYFSREQPAVRSLFHRTCGCCHAHWFAALRLHSLSRACLPRTIVKCCLIQVKFVLLSEARLPENATSSLDFVILYDVLVHVDLHVTNKYVREIFRVLKPGGKAFLSTANFLSPGEFPVDVLVARGVLVVENGTAVHLI